MTICVLCPREQSVGFSRVLAAKKGETMEKNRMRGLATSGERIPPSLYQFLADLSSESHDSRSEGCGMGCVVICSAGGPLKSGL